MPSLRGKLLVASPALTDPNFNRAVVLVAEHTDDGALGLVLNRPSTGTVREIVPALEELVDDEALLYIGGPVQREGVMLLAEFEQPADSARIIFAEVGFLAAGPDDDEAALSAAIRDLRVFAGHSGWGPGQLEAELGREDWIVEDAQPDDVFFEDPAELWSSVLARKGGNFALIARMPVDPSVN
ncbi:MAG: YqgE/AlgH family protein [Thermoleophilaceae bacterium]